MAYRIRFAIYDMHQALGKTLLLQPGHAAAQLIKMRQDIAADFGRARAPQSVLGHKIL